jgi:hypothetical protein
LADDDLKIYDAVVCVLSHNWIFSRPIRQVIRLAYEERFSPNAEERVILDEAEGGQSMVRGFKMEDTSSDDPDSVFQDFCKEFP